jgi:hypothetical protein
MSNKIDLSGGKNQLQPHGIIQTKNALFAHAKTYANRAAREADATLTAADVDTIAFQSDEKSSWLLTAAGPPPVWSELPIVYVAPTFSAFGISGQTTPLEVGDEIATARTFTWTTTTPTSVEANSISLTDVTGTGGGSVVIDSGLANDSSEATAYPVAVIKKTSATSHTFRVGATSTRGVAITREYSVYWQWKRYHGTSAAASLDEAGIKGLLNSALASGFAGSFTFVASNYKYICYAKALGEATSFKDSSTMLDVAMEPKQTVSVENDQLETTEYYVHRTTNVIGSAITIVVA